MRRYRRCCLLVLATLSYACAHPRKARVPTYRDCTACIAAAGPLAVCEPTGTPCDEGYEAVEADAAVSCCAPQRPPANPCEDWQPSPINPYDPCSMLSACAKR